MTRILIVDDDPEQLEHSAAVVAALGYRVERASGGAEALRRLRTDRQYRAVVLDLMMPDTDGMAVLETMRRDTIAVPVLAGLPSASPERVRDVLRHGAMDAFVHPLTPDRFIVAMTSLAERAGLERALAEERAERTGIVSLGDLLGSGASVERAHLAAQRAAKSALPLLVEGEAGTGKAQFARAVHALSDRASRPFIALDCAALEPREMESALFGARRGAIPGLRTDLPGKIADARGGTLYLASVGELSEDVQARLLDLLETDTITPLGATAPEKANVRLIVGTRYRLLNLAKSGRLREDLYYRLSVQSAYLPPLRDRRDELPDLVDRLIPRLAREAGRRITGISGEALGLIDSHPWPGNRRQLAASVYRAIVLCETDTLMPADFPQLVADVLGRSDAAELAAAMASTAPVHIDADLPPSRHPVAGSNGTDRFLDEDGKLKQWEAVERDLIAYALDHHQNRMSAVARALGMGRSTLYRKLREYGLGEEMATN